MSPITLSLSELRYRRLFEAAHDGILLVDPVSRRIIDVNPFLVQFLGYSHAEFIGKELYEIGLLKDEAANQAAFRELQRNGYIRYEDLPLQTKSGQCVDVEFVSNLYVEGDQRVIQCNIRDITERKIAENTLRTLRIKLTQHSMELEKTVRIRTTELQLSNSQLETFVYSIAHDLRAPLRTMQGFSQLLVQEPAIKLSPQGQEYAAYINTAAQTMDHLLTDLLAFSHISQQAIELTPVPLAAAVREALVSCEPEISASGAQIENAAPWPVVLAHGPTLRQVLVNLLTNALKFAGKNAPAVRLWSEERTGGLVRIWVEDHGIGIPLESQARIFQVFQRLHTTEYSGTGIGLAIVQKGVERMGGKTGVVSSPGQGSKFWIELAQAAPAQANPGAPHDH